MLIWICLNPGIYKYMSLYRYLMCEISGLGPDGKYLLVRILLCYLADGGVVSTAKELSEKFGVSLEAVSKALKALEAQGFFTVTSAPDGKGRPKRRFAFSKLLTSALEKVTPPEGYESVFDLEPFLAMDTKPLEGEQLRRPDWDDGVLFGNLKAGSLSATNRLLISVLLAHADKFGIVTSLGTAALRKATGLSGERLTYRLTRLVATGVIREYVPGVSSRPLLGRADSIYVLNLADPELSVLGFEPVVFVKRFPSDAYTGWSSLLGNICNSAHHLPSKIKANDPDLDSFKRLAPVKKFFDTNDRLRVSPILEFRLLSYASTLISKFWDLLPSSPVEVVPLAAMKQLQDGLRERVASDICPPRKKQNPEDVDQESGQSDVLHEFIFEVASRRAAEIKQLLPTLSRDMDYAVLPGGLRAAFLTLLALPKTEAAQAGCYIWQAGANEPECYSSERGLLVPDRLDYGLLGRPKRRVGGPQD